MERLRSSQPILPINSGIGWRPDGQSKRAVPEAEYSKQDAGRVARLDPIYDVQSHVLGGFLSCDPKATEEPGADWRSDATGFYG
jgi:hypothetical protein